MCLKVYIKNMNTFHTATIFFLTNLKAKASNMFRTFWNVFTDKILRSLTQIF